MILGVLTLGGISRYTAWTNAAPIYNVKLEDVFSGLLLKIAMHIFDGTVAAITSV